MTEPSTLADRDAVRAAVARLSRFNAALAAEATKAAAVTAAVTLAAGRNVAFGEPTSSGTAVAPAYAGIVATLEDLARLLTAKVQAATAAVNAEIGGLTALLDDTADGTDTVSDGN